MKRQLLTLVTAVSIITVALPVAQAPAQVPDPLATPNRSCDAPVCAGYGSADATWHVGAGAGQHTAKNPDNVINSVTDGDVDPHGHSIAQQDSYGVQSRLSYRAIAVEDKQGDQVVFVKSDSYLAQDYLSRRAAQLLLTSGSNITYDEIFLMATHNHSSPYYMTPSPGPWVFQDAFDIRAFEYHARAMANAILEAEHSMVPARMGATEVEHELFKGQIMHKGFGDDGSPTGYPDDFGDMGLSVLRFDDMSVPNDPKPLATLMYWGQHPEGLDGHDLITGEYVAQLERFVERDTGAPLVFGQGDVGSSEQGPGRPELVDALGITPEWNHAGHAQGERGAFLLSRDVVGAWQQITAPDGNPVVPYSTDFDVAAGNAFVAGPYSHPYPAANSCRTETTLEGNPGAGSAAECTRAGDDFTGGDDNEFWEMLKESGAPIPDNYDTPSYFALEENARIHLQAFKLGEVIIGSCSCEAQVDLILNFESRANQVQNDIWEGFDWTADNLLPETKEVLPAPMSCTQASPPSGDWSCVKNPAYPRQRAILGPFTVSNDAYQRMKGQIHNDAAGWDLPQNAAAANSEPADPTKIFGNFTHQELPADQGYKLAIGVGHAGDYNGYTVSYREYQAHDHYRKALTSYGAHTADYMVTRMVELAAKLNGVAQQDLEVDIARGAPDEARQLVMSAALGATSFAAYEAWHHALPVDKGPVGVLPEGQPQDITRFNATTFKWRGGSNAVDNPVVQVQRLVDGEWVPFADQSGEIQTKLEFPKGANAFADTYSGNQEWIWTANFEAFDAFPEGIGSTPAGEYRFVVNGTWRSAPAMDSGYEVVSDPFTVSRWDGVKVENLVTGEAGSVSFDVNPIAYPTSYQSEFPYIRTSGKTPGGDDVIHSDEFGRPFCTTCTFRPWATGAHLAQSAVTVLGSDGARKGTLEVDCTPASAELPNQPVAYSCVSDGSLAEGDNAVVFPGDVADTYGETVATCVDSTGEIECPPEPTVSPTPPNDDDDDDDDDGSSHHHRPRRPVSDEPSDGATAGGQSLKTTTLSFTDQSASAGQFSDQATFQARLLDQDGNAVPSAEVKFELVGHGGTDTFTAMTDGSGLARRNVTLDQAPGALQLNARFDGDGLLTGSADTAGFTVSKEDTQIAITHWDSDSVVAKLKDKDAERGGLGGKKVKVSFGGVKQKTFRTNRRGRLSFAIPARYQVDGLVIKLRYAGGVYYLPSTAKVRL